MATCIQFDTTPLTAFWPDGVSCTEPAENTGIQKLTNEELTSAWAHVCSELTECGQDEVKDLSGKQDSERKPDDYFAKLHSAWLRWPRELAAVSAQREAERLHALHITTCVPPNYNSEKWMMAETLQKIHEALAVVKKQQSSITATEKNIAQPQNSPIISFSISEDECHGKGALFSRWDD